MRILYLISAFSVILFSCEKNKKDTDVTDITVLSGIYDSRFIQKDYDTGFSVLLKKVGCWEMEGIDSIDIDNNGNYDFILRTGDLNDTPYEICCPNPDTTILIDCYPSFFQYYQIVPNGTFEILSDGIYDSISKKTTFFVDTLNYKEAIHTKNNWHSGDEIYFYTYNKPPDGGYGQWTKITSSKYVGFRFTINEIMKYGWMRIEKTDKLTIKEIAYLK